jgi:hypothetical protein
LQQTGTGVAQDTDKKLLAKPPMPMMLLLCAFYGTDVV